MAWRSHGVDNASLIAKLTQNSIIHNPRVQKAMMLVDRGNFVHNIQDAYYDNPVPIGHGATISAPHMHAHVLELLADKLIPGAKVLDVGSGSGYLLATFAQMVFNPATLDETSSNNNTNGSTSATTSSASSNVSSSLSSSSSSSSSSSINTTGRVYGVEHIPELVTWSIANLKKNNQTKEWLSTGLITVKEADGRYGLPDSGPYDCIHVGAAAPQIPKELIEQLANNGKLILPVGPNGGDQVLIMITKDNSGKLQQEVLMGVRYVPLTSRDFQESHQ